MSDKVDFDLTDLDVLLSIPLDKLIETTLREPEGPKFWLMTGILTGRIPDKYRPLRRMLLDLGRAWKEDRVRHLLCEMAAALEGDNKNENEVH